MRFFALVLLLVGVTASAVAQAAPATPSAVVTFTYERKGMDVPRFSLSVGEDGSGHYSAMEVARRGVAEEPQVIERAVTMSPGRVKAVFAAARELKFFQVGCAATLKGVASLGAKTLRYAGPDGAGRCAYDYADDKRVMLLTDVFLAMAATLDEGRVLDTLHRFDRLGLDEEISGFADEVKKGNAIELENIEPTLRGIAGDAEVIERVRVRAGDLLTSRK